MWFNQRNLRLCPSKEGGGRGLTKQTYVPVSFEGSGRGPNKMYVFVFQVMTGWEAKNKFRVLNNMGQQIYFATEGKA